MQSADSTRYLIVQDENWKLLKARSCFTGRLCNTASIPGSIFDVYTISQEQYDRRDGQKRLPRLLNASRIDYPTQ
jgi:hypothetical protein